VGAPEAVGAGARAGPKNPAQWPAGTVCIGAAAAAAAAAAGAGARAGAAAGAATCTAPISDTARAAAPAAAQDPPAPATTAPATKPGCFAGAGQYAAERKCRPSAGRAGSSSRPLIPCQLRPAAAPAPAAALATARWRADGAAWDSTGTWWPTAGEPGAGAEAW